MRYRFDKDTDFGSISVSTLVPFDCKSANTWETAISHPKYNEGNWIIVEEYQGEYDAKTGHDKWVHLLETDTLPNEIEDVGGGIIGKICNALSGGLKFTRQD